MPYIHSAEDGASLFYIDYRPPQAHPFRPDLDSISHHKSSTLLFLHGWPMNGRMYEHLMLPLSQTYGIRCIAIDRRGFGKSEWSGPQGIDITFETFARDSLTVIKFIPDLGPFTFVTASMACGESLLVYEMMKSAGLETQVKGFIWLGPSLPNPLQTPDNPHAPPQEVWDMILDGFRQDRVSFVKASIGGVFGIHQGVEMGETALEFFSGLVHEGDAVAIERCCQILSNYNFTQKLKTLGQTKPSNLKVTVLHGAKDQSMSIEAASGPLKALIPDIHFKIYENAAHGLYYTAAREVIEDILAQVS